MRFFKKKGILYSGSFDPVHIGHVKVVKFLVEKYPKRTIYVLPQYYFEKSDPLLSLKTRIETLEKVFENYPRVKVMNLASYWEQDCRSLYLMANLVKMFEDLDVLDLAMGSEVFNKIRGFEYPLELIRDYNFIIFQRSVVDHIPDYFTHTARKVWYDLTEPSDTQITSSKIRGNLGDYQWWIPELARILIIKKLENGEEL